MIEIGTKWQHKDGGVYEVVSLTKSMDVPVVWYSDKHGEEYVRTEKHFLESFKPYEPEYEYQWVVEDIELKLHITNHYTEEEILRTNKMPLLQRIDQTKRERKQ